MAQIQFQFPAPFDQSQNALDAAARTDRALNDAADAWDDHDDAGAGMEDEIRAKEDARRRKDQDAADAAQERVDAARAVWALTRDHYRAAERAATVAILDEVAHALDAAPAGGWHDLRAAVLEVLDAGSAPMDVRVHYGAGRARQTLPGRVLEAARGVGRPDMDWESLGLRSSQSRLGLFPHLTSASPRKDTRARAAWLVLEAAVIERGAAVLRFREALARPDVARVTRGHRVAPGRWNVYRRDPTSPTGVQACGGIRRSGVTDQIVRECRHAPVQGGRGLK